MIRKIVILLIIAGCGVSLFLSYSFLKEEAAKHRDPMETVPVNAAVIIECHDIRSMWSRISETNLVWSKIAMIPEVQKIDRKIRTVDSLFSLSEEQISIISNKQTVLSFHPNDVGVDLFFATVCNESQFSLFEKLIKETATKVESIEILKTKVKSFVTEEGIYQYAYVSPFIIFSSSKEVLENSLRQIKGGKSLLEVSVFEELRKTSSYSAALHCYINFETLERLAFPYLQKSVADNWQSGGVFPNWAAFDLSLKSDAVLFSGLSMTNSKNKLLNSIFNQEPQQSIIRPNLPKDITLLKRVSLSDPKKFITQNGAAYLEEIEENCQCDPIEAVSSWLGSEILFLNHSLYQSGSIQTVLIETNGAENVLGQLTTLGVNDSVIKNNHGINIYSVTNYDFLELFGKEYRLDGDVYFCQYEDYVIFSSLTGINKILLQWRREKEVLVQQTNYSSFSDRFMANFSSSDFYFRCDRLIASLENVLKREYYLKIKSYNEVFKKLGSVSWQTSPSENKFQYHSLALNAQQGVGEGSNFLWSLKLKSPVIRSPELMKNHRTNTLEVLLQDKENSLHLISATGKVKWSKRIESPIMGKVKQIDVYGNNKWQMLFNTSSKIHLIDINGNEVEGFPVELKAPATNSLAVFDYDRTKVYRILIACSDKKIYNYNQEGVIVEGWNCNSTESLVVNELEHFVSESKDYILFSDLSGKIYMVDRRGGERVSLTQKINTKLHESIKFEKGFSFSTSKLSFKDSNNICLIDFNDSKTCFKLDTSHQEYDLSIVDLDNDNLSEYVINYLNRVEIYGPDKKLNLYETFDFNLKHQVKVLGDKKKYLLIANDEEIHLYSDKITPIPKFPAPGSVFTTIGDINKDGKVNVVTILPSNELKVYSLQGLEVF